MIRIRVKVEELRSLKTGVANSELNTIGVERPLPPAGSTGAEIDTVTDSQKLVSVIINFDAFSKLFPGTPAEESLSGVKHFALLDRLSRTRCLAS